MRAITMEIHNGHSLLFLTMSLICFYGNHIGAQDSTKALSSNDTANSTDFNNTSLGNTTAFEPNNTDANTRTTTVSPFLGNDSDSASNIPTTVSSDINSTQDNNNTTNGTTTSTTSTTLVPTTTTTQATTVKDHCAGSPCKNGYCSNAKDTYICNCDPEWTGLQCENKLVLWNRFAEYGAAASNSSIRLISPIPFPYFQQQITELYVHIGGYVSFGSSFFKANAPVGTDWPYAPNLFAVYWSDIDIPEKNTAFSYYTEDKSQLTNLTAVSPLADYVKSVVNISGFEPLYLACITWVDVMPKPAQSYSSDKATFQLILATDSKYSYAIKNYQKVWGNLGTYGRPRVSTDYTGENHTRVTQPVPSTSTGGVVVKLFSNGTPNGASLECAKKVLNVKSQLGTEVESLYECPCYWAQAQKDIWFKQDSSATHCYTSILSNSGGLHQKCCYDTIGVLITNTKEAMVPVGNASGGVMLQEAYNQCCTEAPQLCGWFYRQFPTSDCSNYTDPLIGVTFDETFTVTFDNNSYSFNGLGDFVLYKSRDTEVQIRTKKNDKSNTTSAEAIAVKVVEDRNSSVFVFYTQSDKLLYNEPLGTGVNASQISYIILPLNSGGVRTEASTAGVKLVLPTVAVVIKNSANGLSVTVNLLNKDPDSKGLLGSADGEAANDFKFGNGTQLNVTAEHLSTLQITEFAMSWKINNETDSYIHYNESRSFEVANNDTGFIPLQLPTIVAQINDSKIKELCDMELFCVQKYFISNDNASAAGILKQMREVYSLKTSIAAPRFTSLPENIHINRSSVYVLELASINDAELNFSSDSLQVNGLSLINKTFTWNVSESLMELRVFRYPKILKIIARNSNAVSSQYAPTINLCLCEMPSQCDVSYNTNNHQIVQGNVHNILCSCGDRAGGEFCEIQVDVCKNCYNETSCNASAHEYCAPCPEGYGGDGKICEDINECIKNNGGCDHKCNNTEGSYNCSCSSGYRQNGNKCTDINECLEDANICKDNSKHCTNLPGSYSCSCYPGLVGKEKCIKAPYTFVGTANLANSGNQSWNDDLNNPASSKFKELAAKVQHSMELALVDGGVGNKDTLYIDILSFELVQNAARKKRDTSTSKNYIIAQFIIYLANNSITSDALNQALRDFLKTVCNTSCQYGDIILLSGPPTVNSNISLCDFPQVHKCDLSTSYCVQSQQQTLCKCRPGYDTAADSLTCRDIDECATNSTNNCTATGVCINTVGSYKCLCSSGQFWDVNTTTCVADACASNPCQNGGVCYVLRNPQAFACRCSYGWEGSLCENEDAEAYRLKVAVICVSVILGVCCLILLIILIVICIKRRRSGSDWSPESDTYTNSRYGDADHLPRVKLAHRTGTDMSENGRGSSYDRLDSGLPGDKHTSFGRHAPTDDRTEGSRNVYKNQAYEADAGERL